MTRLVKVGLIQTSTPLTQGNPDDIKKAMIDRHIPFI